ncbi:MULTISPECIES: D-alanyl-D-alanine endopeptidase [Pseudomonas]|uniref:D-alanyl-D-alanine endopeptidase n=1 Tax=Pseudomonas TaxID=286 RepID=UPI0021E0E5DC|nr:MULTISPECIES: D-alanyl-D-alanine endopeptidase [unclassified Pseudomonas]MCU9947632.1 D-alanyl-D-alanine endopeptidase [Pseudomonas sp. PDM13]MDU9414880.1 D-alanyl-D-alanine endopeptidase [Pseudomonas sp. zfem005]WCD81812.1 D-alanyl-D-alanine endopeptidase [Pseudomonas sp. TUM22785]
MKIRTSLFKALFLCTSLALASPANAQTPAPLRDPAQLQLASGSAMLLDLKTNKIIYSNNPDLVVPIASVTKLMTALVVLEAKQSMSEVIAIDISQTKEMKGVYSRVRLGSQATRHDMLLMALMSSENRAAATLAHHYPGGYPAFIAAMNAKARALGMKHTRFVEPTGLSLNNVSTAHDLVQLLVASNKYPLLSELSTTKEKTITFVKPRYSLGFSNTNHLTRKADWNIELTKTGFTDEAGHCLVMRTRMGNQQVAMVLLDAFGKYTHFADATRMRRWVETGKSGPIPVAAKAYRQQKDSARKQQMIATPN